MERNHCAKQLRRLLQLCRAESNQAGRKTHTDRPTDRQANSGNGRTDIQSDMGNSIMAANRT